MIIQIDDIEITIGNTPVYGSVECDFIANIVSACFNGHPDNWTPDESEYEIKVTGFDFTDEDGESIDVDMDTVQDEIDRLDAKGFFSTEWEKVVEQDALDRALAKAGL